MTSTLIEAGLLSNQDLIGSSNPHECDDFKFQITYEDIIDPTDEYMYHTWELTGNVPVGIVIDRDGLINGYIAIYNDQPSCQDNFPDEEILRDGSNWENTGRFRDHTYQFDFTVHRFYTYLDTLTSTEITKEAVTDVSILTVKNADIDNLIFVRKYLEAGHELKIGDVKYFEKDFDQYILDHPGPFGECNKG